MKSRLQSIAVFCVCALAVLFGALFVVQQATSGAVKERLETLLSERTGLTTTINGPVRWRYLWPTAITIEDISASNERGSEYWIADSLRLEASTLSVIGAPRSPANWRFQAFQLQQLRGERGASVVHEGRGSVQDRGSATDRESATCCGDQYAITEFWIRSISDDAPAPFAATLRYRPRDDEPVDLQLAGKLHFVAEQRRLEFDPAIVSGNLANGECKADIALRPINEPASGNASVPTSSATPTVLNADLWRRSDWDLNCQFSTLILRDTTFESVTLVSNNLLGSSTSQLTLPNFFTGSAELNLTIDASSAQVIDGAVVPRWVITPIVQSVASGPLLSWLQQSESHNAAPHPWQGPVSIAGRLETSGNSRPALVNNALGEITLNSNNGTLDMTQLKRDIEGPLKELGPLVGDAEEIRKWPDKLEYLTMTGRWVPEGNRQLVNGRLDNLSLDAVALLDISASDPGADTLKANGTFTFQTDQPPMSLPVPPVLADLPLPVACDGTPTLPRCALDSRASQQILADVMQGRGPDGLSRKLDELIDENVPEEYRRAARSLLEILGHSIDDADAEELEDFLVEDLEELAEQDPNASDRR